MRLCLPALFTAAALSGCGRPDCTAGMDPRCVVPPPCPELAFTCDGGAAGISLVTSAADVPPGLDALAALGDFRLENDQIVAIVDALDHPHYLAPTGGALIDLTTKSGGDSMRALFQVTGVLPEEAAAYHTAEILREDGVAALLLRGTLDGRPDVPIATRYEVRPCEPGVRIRTELVNLEADPMSALLADGWYFGDRELEPFVPLPGQGFIQPSFGLSTLGDALRSAPFSAAAGHSDPAVSYATVACNAPETTGFRSNNVSAEGIGPQVVMPGDALVWERFVAVADGASVAPAADIALEVRRQLFGEPSVEVRGQVIADGLGQPARASVQLVRAEGDVPWTQVFPGPDGRFSARVPPASDYLLRVESFGRTLLEQAFAADDDTDLGAIPLPDVGRLRIDATVDGQREPVLVFVHPADEATRQDVEGRLWGTGHTCAPLLGHAHGPSPACDRVLVDGPTEVFVPPGTYDLYAVSGLFSTLGAATGLRVDGGALVEATLAMSMLDLQPAGTLTGDFHVHGGASFDSNIPDLDRARAMIASRVQVIASTEHDTAWSWQAAVDALGGSDRLRVLTGTESTGHILHGLPHATVPKVFGHWNIWPLPFDPLGAWRGAPWDEKAEPGELFDRAVAQGWDPDRGIVQLNHPTAPNVFARDQGWASALQIDATVPLPTDDDGTLQWVFLRTPPGASFGNADYDAQEVMNSSANEGWLQYRAFWFYLLQQGIVRPGTANSDSHSLTENVVGLPLTLVYGGGTLQQFDADDFHAAIKSGHMVGTGGPILEATVRSGDDTWLPSVFARRPDAGARLRIKVRAAPWIPVEEVRVIVNGEVAQRWDGLPQPDPFGGEGLDRFEVEVALADLLPDGDAWLVVEAGAPIEPNDDLDCNGIPDTGDNNRDGVIDWRDVAGQLEAPAEPCEGAIGPLTDPEVPDDPNDARWLFQRVSPRGFPQAFTNPFLVDADGDGFEGTWR